MGFTLRFRENEKNQKKKKRKKKNKRKRKKIMGLKIKSRATLAGKKNRLIFFIVNLV